MTFITLRDIAKNINDSIFYSIMANELADNFWLPISIHPQLVVKQRSYQECSSLIQLLLSILWKIGDETVSNARHIGGEDIKGMLSKVQVEERFMKRSELIHKKKDFLQILREHELYDKEQICTLHRKSKRSAKCSGCKNVLEVGVLAVKVIGAISVPFGKTTAVEQVFYFCPKRHCFTKVPKWCNVKMPIQIVAEEGISQAEIDKFWYALFTLFIVSHYVVFC